jgi:hypothetical protein
MQTIDFPTLADDVRKLSAQGAGRTRQLHRLIDLHASAEAAAALRAATARTRVDAGVFASVLRLAAPVLADRSLTAEDASRDRLRDLVASPEFLALLIDSIRDLREIASSRPDTGACTLASALEVWSWAMNYFRTGEGALGTSATQAIDEMAEVLCPLLAARCLVLEVAAKPSREGELRADLSHTYAARAASAAGAACAELVFGYRRHLLWDDEGCGTCYASDELDDLGALMPGITSGAGITADIIKEDGSHPAKRGPCVRFDGVDTFMRLRNRLDGCLTGAGLARERAAATITRSIAATTPVEVGA